MNHHTAGVKVVSILGEDYSIKAPAGEEQTLLDAAMMLKAALDDTKRKYPTLIGDRLLVLAAMNLCSQQIEMKKQHKEELDRYQSKSAPRSTPSPRPSIRVDGGAHNQRIDCRLGCIQSARLLHCFGHLFFGGAPCSCGDAVFNGS